MYVSKNEDARICDFWNFISLVPGQGFWFEIDSTAKHGELRSNELPSNTDLTTDLIEFDVMALNWDDLMSTGDTIAFTFTNPPLSKILELQMSKNEKKNNNDGGSARRPDGQKMVMVWNWLAIP